jgi:Domain of unknown function (DUF4376)
MKAYTVYSLTTGAIIGSGSCQDCDLSAQARAGEGILEGFAGDLERQRVDLSLTPHALAPIIVPTKTLAQLKDEAKTRAASRRWEVEAGGTEWGGVKIATDDRSKMLLMGAKSAALLDPDFSVRWKTENGWVTLTAEPMIAVADAVTAHVAACFAREEQIAAMVDAVADEASLVGIEPSITAFWAI